MALWWTYIGTHRCLHCLAFHCQSCWFFPSPPIPLLLLEPFKKKSNLKSNVPKWQLWKCAWKCHRTFAHQQHTVAAGWWRLSHDYRGAEEGDIIESGGGFPVPHFHTNENEEYHATAPILPPGFANCGIAPEQAHTGWWQLHWILHNEWTWSRLPVVV